jgi:hypothetical protein
MWRTLYAVRSHPNQQGHRWNGGNLMDCTDTCCAHFAARLKSSELAIDGFDFE